MNINKINKNIIKKRNIKNISTLNEKEDINIIISNNIREKLLKKNSNLIIEANSKLTHILVSHLLNEFDVLNLKSFILVSKAQLKSLDYINVDFLVVVHGDSFFSRNNKIKIVTKNQIAKLDNIEEILEKKNSDNNIQPEYIKLLITKSKSINLSTKTKVIYITLPSTRGLFSKKNQNLLINNQLIDIIHINSFNKKYLYEIVKKNI